MVPLMLLDAIIKIYDIEYEHFSTTKQQFSDVRP